MKLKTYRAASIADALCDIKRDLGTEAVILHTRTFKAGGVLGFGTRKMFEITATTSEAVAPRRAPRTPLRPAAEDTPVRSAGEALLNKAYAAGVLSTHGAAEARAQLDARAEAVRDEVRLASGLAEPPAVPAASRSGAETPVPAPAVSTPPTVLDTEIASEIASIKKLVGQVLTRTHHHAPSMPDSLFGVYTKLLEAELADDLADEIVADVRRELDDAELEDTSAVRRAVVRRLSAMIPAAEGAMTPPRRAPDGRPLTIALVGPTGVGKTTTIAKLAATYKLRHGKNVGLVTSDTYRIAAVDQLRTYANIIGLPLEVVTSPGDMEAACRRLSQRDVVLIDTAGRSPSDDQRIEELRAYITAAAPHETHLVLSSAASEKAMVNAAERFAGVEPGKVIFTKLDESVGFGVIVNAARRIGVKLSFVTTGQEVPDHIEPGCPRRLAALVLDGELDR